MLRVSSPDALRAGIPSNCTSVVGSIVITEDYTGPFVLNGITNFNGSIADFLSNVVASDAVLSGGDDTPVSLPGLTAFEMQDLVHMDSYSYNGGISLKSVPALTSVSIPKATYITDIVFGNFSEAAFDFSSLMNASSINISGDTISRYGYII